MPKKYHVALDDDQRQASEARSSGPLTLRQRNRIDALLRKRFDAEGLGAASAERPRKGAPPKLDGKQEAAISALACSPTEGGRARWSIRRPSERAVAPEVVESVSREAVRRLLKKTR